MNDSPAPTVFVEEAQPKRLHPGTLLVRAPQMIRSVLNSWPLFAILVAQGNWLFLGLAAVAIAAISAVSIFLYWLRFSYTIDDGEIRIDSGVISRQHRVIPFDRVQDVNIEQGPIARMIGLAKVKLETGGSASAGSEEGELNAISMAEADSLRDTIRDWRADHRSAVATVQSEVQEGDDAVVLGTPIFTMDLRRVLTAGLFNFSLTLFAILFGALQYFDEILPFDPFEPDQWIAYIGEDNPLLAYISAHRAIAIISGLAVVAIVGVLSGIILTVLREYGFKLERTATGLRRRRGLITLTDAVVPVKRVQAAVIETGIIRKFFRWYALKLQSLASDSGNADHVVAPLARRDEIDPILAQVGFHATRSEADNWQRVHPALWRMLGWVAIPLSLVAATIAVTFDSRAWFAVPIFLWWIVARWRAWSHHRFVFDGRQLEVTSGWWKQRHMILPMKNIQTIDIDQGPLLRMRGLAELRFGVAGQSALSVTQITAIPLDTARALRERLLP